MAQQVSAKTTDGVNVGQDGDKVGFFGTTPTTKATLAAAGALSSGSTTPADIAEAFVELYNELAAKGLVG